MQDMTTEAYARFAAERREAILGRIADACRVAGRDPGELDALAVSKTVGVDEFVAAWQAGWRHFAENRPQELVRKLTALEARPEVDGWSFDMIGNLQKNKINQVVGKVRTIHSIKDERLAADVAKRSLARGVTSRVLLEVNVSGEESKSGFSPEGAREAFARIVEMPGIEVHGLMTMAPAGDPTAARRTFSGLRELAERLRGDSGMPLETLSCGMSDDFPIAIEEGSTLVRLGRVVFDPKYQLER